MTYFLERIASHLLDEYGDRLEKQCLVFPNRRAGLYFLKYLSLKAGKPVWAPAVRTINELFTTYSSFKLAEPETLIFELYKVYRVLNKKAESFDEFYFWGEMILNDFDDVDKYLVDARRLFTNITDLKKIDTAFGGLTEEQIKIVRQFWVNFKTGSETREKADFMNIWSLLPEIYKNLYESLSRKGIAYEGMIFRELAEDCDKGKFPEFRWETFHFIGFNALNNCEKKLLHSLKKEGKARFYWDYDISYTEKDTSHSAGFFIRSNLKEFGNDMPPDWNYSTLLSGDSGNLRRRIIDTPSDVAQVKLIPELLGELNEITGDEACHTAIVLADETLLIPLISSIPGSVEDVNITMGYPLKFSPVYSLIKHLLSLQKNSRKERGEELFDHIDVFNLLRHSYFSEENVFHSTALVSKLVKENKQWIPASSFMANPPFEFIFRRVDDSSALPSYLRKILETIYITDDDEAGTLSQSGPEKMIRNEFIYSTLLVINRIESVISDSKIPLSSGTWIRLLDKILKGISIPFSGEPLKGIQIMGILETRALNFRNLIILSVNEGKLPRSSAGTSYIPYNLREAFGLPTIRHQDSIYAYYFYRLLHKAENVTFVYNSNSEGLRTGEMSRFLLQLSFLDLKPPEIYGVTFEITTPDSNLNTVRRDQRHTGKLGEHFFGPAGKALSPSAVNTWLNCRMKFYYRYICGLEEPAKIIKEIDPAMFGGLLHGIMEKIYSPFRGRILDKVGIISLLGNPDEINRATEEIIRIRYHNSDQADQSGNEQIIAGILNSYVNIILRHDMTVTPFSLMDLEKRVSAKLEIMTEKGKTEISAGGIIDRLDKTGNSIRVIDYKTGIVPMEIKSVESLFDENDDKRNEAWFQILMYCEILSANDSNGKIKPSIYPVRSLPNPEFHDYLVLKTDKKQVIQLDDFSIIRDNFKTGLRETIEKMFNSHSDFSMTEHIRKCEFCPYRQLCRR